jgi:hypothetical protein
MIVGLRDEAAVAASSDKVKWMSDECPSHQKTTSKDVDAVTREDRRNLYYSRCATENGKRQSPAFGKQCGKCGTYDHCRDCLKRSSESEQPRVNTVDDDEQDEEEYLLNCFEFADDEDDWFEEVKITGQAVVFKLDTGA